MMTSVTSGTGNRRQNPRPRWPRRLFCQTVTPAPIHVVETLACPDCGQRKTIEVTDAEWLELSDPNGRDIQLVLRRLSADDRERLITGICPKCWDVIFAGVDE